MSYIFYSCSSLTSLNLSNFNISRVSNMNLMFYECSSLTSLNLSSFDTSNVEDMSEMFFGCLSLISLDLSNFETSNAIYMAEMFYECSSLISLDLSNFDTSNIENIDYIFYNCEKLEYVNLKLAKINPGKLASSGECSNYPSKLTICSEDENWKKIFHSEYKTYINCANNISFLKINENEQMMKCFKNTDDLNNPCQICGNNYIEKSIFSNDNNYINCYENKDGYYFDDDLLEYKLCYNRVQRRL